ncbi:signal peptidase I [Patescibacteria group bacterium]|nr:signal peptidase I [Patescibacteria group bacterium]
MKILKTLVNIIYWLAITVLLVIAAGTAFSVLKTPGGYRALVVQSGSMEPTVKTGSVVVVGPQDTYQKDDIITFFANPNEVNLKNPKSTVTHRIIETEDKDGQVVFKTKGNANEDPDREAVSAKQVLGRVKFSIPYLGYGVAFAKTQTGFIALIVIPGTLIIYSELMNIKKEIQRLLLEWKEKRQKKKSKTKKEKPAKKIADKNKKSKSKPKPKSKKK